MTILGIETSCDETAVGIVADRQILLAHIVASQVKLHNPYGGVVPEIAARSHLEVIIPVIDQALKQARLKWDQIDALAVANGPGLAGSLLVGTTTAASLALSLNKPLYCVNHVQSHVYANFLTESQLAVQLVDSIPEFPLLALIVSGKHSQLVLFDSHNHWRLLGQAVDDALGEAFDKVGRLLGLGYPGGPAIAKIGQKGDDCAYQLPIARLNQPYDFSFSGLKTAVLRLCQQLIKVDHNYPSHQIGDHLSQQQIADLAASFQKTAIETVVAKTRQAYDQFRPRSVVIAGGVGANSHLRASLAQRLPINISYADISLCTDNGAMVAALAGWLAGDSLPATDPGLALIEPGMLMAKINH